MNADQLLDALVSVIAGPPVDPAPNWNEDDQGNPVSSEEADHDPNAMRLVVARELIVELFDRLKPPAVIRREQADNWHVTVHELPGGKAVRLVDANPHRMFMEMSRVGAYSDPDFATKLAILVRIGPSQKSAESNKTSAIIGSTYRSAVAAEIWAWSDTAIDLEVVEYFRSGLASGQLRGLGGN